MATYNDIAQYVSRNYGKSMRTCWIAHVKERNGLNPRRAPNRFRGKGRVNKCPSWAQPLIEEALKRYKMI